MRLQGRHKYTALIVALLVILFGITVGYASIATGLLINGTADIEGTNWNVHFTEPVVLPGSTEIGTEKNPYKKVSIDDTLTQINYQVVFLKPGDYYEFTFNVVNDGEMDAKVESILQTVGKFGNNNEYVSLEVIDTNTGETVKKNDILRAHESRPLKMKIVYKTDAEHVTGVLNVDIVYALDFVQYSD